MEQNNQISGSVRDEALYLISLGYPVIPICSPQHQEMNAHHRSKCESYGKTPLLKNWTQWTNTTPEDIHSWFRQNSFINIGIPMGQISGLIGIDIDGKSGEIVLLALSNGDIPETWEFNTGNGRRLLYSLPKGIATKKMTMTGDAPHEGFEILCDGQQSVVPFSTHVSGKKYLWKQGHSPRDIQIASAPKWVLDQITVKDQPQERQSQPVTEEDWARILQEGSRNEGIARQVGSLVGRGLPHEQVMQFIKV